MPTERRCRGAAAHGPHGTADIRGLPRPTRPGFADVPAESSAGLPGPQELWVTLNTGDHLRRAGPRGDGLHPSHPRPGGHRCAAQVAAPERRPAHVLLPARTSATGSTRTDWYRPWPWPDGSGWTCGRARRMIRSSCYAGTVIHRRLERADAPLHLPRLHAPGRPRRSVRELDRRAPAASVTTGVVWSVFATRDHSVSGARARGSRCCSRSRAPAPPGRCRSSGHACRVFGLRVQPRELLLLLRPDGRSASGRRGQQHLRRRHAYVLPIEVATSRRTVAGTMRHSWTTKKVMHVSPFFPLDGSYTWKFEAPGRACLGAGRSHAGRATDVHRVVRCRAASAERCGPRCACSRTYPLMTAKVVGAIHWEALKLWVKGAPFRSQPAGAPDSDAAGQGVP